MRLAPLARQRRLNRPHNLAPVETVAVEETASGAKLARSLALRFFFFFAPNRAKKERARSGAGKSPAPSARGIWRADAKQASWSRLSLREQEISPPETV